MKAETKVLTLKSLFTQYVNASSKAEKNGATLTSEFVRIITAAHIKQDDKDGRKKVRATLRRECGLPEKPPIRMMGADGKQAAKVPRENAFDVLLHRAFGKVWPKTKPEKVDKVEATTADTDSGVPTAKGMTQRTQAYALVLQDLATAKTKKLFGVKFINSLETSLNLLKQAVTVEG